MPADLTARILDHRSTRRRKAIPRTGRYLVGTVGDDAICLSSVDVDHATLRDIFAEVRAAGLHGCVHVYGTVSLMGETRTYRFWQIGRDIPA